jgi:hypothetical protein
MIGTTAAEALVSASGVYLLVGTLVAIAFVFRGAGKIDPAAARGSLGFRLAILPGCIALWPLMLMFWRRGHGKTERNAHRDLARQSQASKAS